MSLIPRLFFTCLLALVTLRPGHAAETADADIVARSQQALASLRDQVSAAAPLLDEAAGVLVFPEVVKVGFGGGDEYGEGCLMVAGRPVAFYASAGARYGLPLGAGAKSEVVLFMDASALQAFRARPAWEVGVDGDVSLVRLAAGGGIAGSVAGEPVLGFIFTGKGLAGGLNLDGARFPRLAR